LQLKTHAEFSRYKISVVIRKRESGRENQEEASRKKGKKGKKNKRKGRKKQQTKKQKKERKRKKYGSPVYLPHSLRFQCLSCKRESPYRCRHEQ
jgi:hypothetical protein